MYDNHGTAEGRDDPSLLAVVPVHRDSYQSTKHRPCHHDDDDAAAAILAYTLANERQRPFAVYIPPQQANSQNKKSDLNLPLKACPRLHV
jgi:hypothetical protein